MTRGSAVQEAPALRLVGWGLKPSSTAYTGEASGKSLIFTFGNYFHFCKIKTIESARISYIKDLRL